MMEMDAGAAATTSNEEEDGQCARRTDQGEMDHKQGGGSSRDLPTQAKPEGGGAKLTKPAKPSAATVQGNAKSTDCQDGSQTKKTDPCHSKTTSHTVVSSDGKQLPGSSDRTSQSENTARAPMPAKSPSMSDKVSSKPLLPPVKSSVASSSVPVQLPGPSGEVPKPPKVLSAAGGNDAAKTTQSGVSSSISSPSGKTTACSSREAQSSSANPHLPSSGAVSESGVTTVVTGKSPGDKVPAKVFPTTSCPKPGTFTSVPGTTSAGLSEKNSGKSDTITKTSPGPSTLKPNPSQPSSSPVSSSKPLLSRSPAISSPVVSSSTSTKPAVASSITKSPSPATLPTAPHSARNVPSSSSCSASSSSSISSPKTSQPHGPPFKPIPKIPPVMPAVKPKINPPKFSSLVSSSSLQKPSTTHSSSSASSASNIPKSPSSAAPKPSVQTASRPSLSPNIRPLMSIKVTCPSSFTSSRVPQQYSSHSHFSSGSRAPHNVSSPLLSSSMSGVTSSSPRAALSSSPHRVPSVSPRTPTQPVHSISGNQRSNSSSQSVSSSVSHSLPSRFPAVPPRHSSPAEPPRPSSTSRANEPLPVVNPRRVCDRTSARPDFSVPDVRRDCPAGPDSAAPSASQVPDVLRTGSAEEDRRLERMLQPTPFGGGIPPPHMPDLCRRGGEPSMVQTQPILPSSAETDVDLLRPASAGSNPRPRIGDLVPVDNPQPHLVVEPEASLLVPNAEPSNSDNQACAEEGDQVIREESGVSKSDGENVLDSVTTEDGTPQESRSEEATFSGTSVSKVEYSNDSHNDEKGANVAQASGSDGGSIEKKKELPAESEPAKGEGDRHGQVTCSNVTVSDQKKSSSDRGAMSVKSDSDAVSTSESVICDSKAPQDRTCDQSNSKGKSSLPLGKAVQQEPSGSSELPDKQQYLVDTPPNLAEEHTSASLKGERMTVEKADEGKESLVEAENNSSLMIPPPTANLPKVLVMGDEAKGREGDRPQKEGKKEVVVKEEKKKEKEISISTSDSGLSTAKSHAECDKPESSEEVKPVEKLIENISPKPSKTDSATLSSKANSTCEGGIVTPKDCDAVASGRVDKNVVIVLPETSQENESHPLPVAKNIHNSISSSDKSSLGLPVPVKGKSVVKTSGNVGNKDANGSGDGKGGVKLKMVSHRATSGDLKDKADLNSCKSSEVNSKVSGNQELLRKDNKLVAGEMKKALDSVSHDEAVEHPELKKSVVDCQHLGKAKCGERSDVAAKRAPGDKGVPKSVHSEGKLVNDTGLPESRGLSQGEENSKVTETPIILTEGDSNPDKICNRASDKKDSSISEENKINDKHKDDKVQADLAGDDIVKTKGELVAIGTKMPEKVSCSSISGEPVLVKESKRSQQANLESVPIVPASISGAENQSISVKSDSKKNPLSQIVDGEPQVESKSDKNAPSISGNSSVQTNLPSQVQISDEILKVVDEAPKLETLDNNETFSDGGVVKEKSLRLSESGSSSCGVNVGATCSKDSNDLKILIKSEKVATVIESKPVVSPSSSTLIKTDVESITQKSVDSIDELEIANESVDSDEKTTRTIFNERVDNTSSLSTVHSNINSKVCDGGSGEEFLGMSVDRSGQVCQGKPVLNVKDEKMRLPPASLKLQDAKPSSEASSAPAGASQSDKKLDVVSRSSPKATIAKDEKGNISDSDKTHSQPTEASNVILKPILSEGPKSVTIVFDEEASPVSSKIKAVKETVQVKSCSSKIQVTSDPIKISANDGVLKVESTSALVTQTSCGKTSIATIQAKKEIGISKDRVTTLTVEKQVEGNHDKSSGMVVASVLDIAKECDRDNSSLGHDVICMKTVPDLKKSSDGPAMEKNRIADTTVVEGDKPDLISRSHTASVVKTPEVLSLVTSNVSSTLDEGIESNKVDGTQIKSDKNIPAVENTEVNEAAIIDSPGVNAALETSKSTETQMVEKQQSIDFTVSKNISVAQVKKVEVSSEKKVCAFDNSSSVLYIESHKRGEKNPIEVQNIDQKQVNCSQEPVNTKTVTSTCESNPMDNKISLNENPSPGVAQSSDDKQGEKGIPEKSVSPMVTPMQSNKLSEESTCGRQSVTSKTPHKESKSLLMPCMDGSQSSSKTNSSKMTNTVKKDSKATLEEEDDVNTSSIEAEASSHPEAKNVEIHDDASLKEKLSQSSAPSSDYVTQNVCKSKLKVNKSVDNVSEQKVAQKTESSIVVSAELSQSNSLITVESSDCGPKPFPDLLNESTLESSTEKTSKDLERNVAEEICTLDKAAVKEIVHKVDTVCATSLEKNVVKDGGIKSDHGVEVCVKHDGDKLSQVEPTVKPSTDQKSLSDEPGHSCLLPPKLESKVKAPIVSQDALPTVGERRTENSSVVFNDPDNADSKLKKRVDMRHPREKSILGITEKLAVANQMRQQKQGTTDSTLKETSSPKKMPGLIEMGVAKASRRKNLLVKDDQRIFKKTKVASVQESSEAVFSKDLSQPPTRQGVEITLGKSEVTLGMGQTSEMVKSVPKLQPEVVIAAELPGAEKVVPLRKEDGVGLDSCNVIDLSSKSVDSLKDTRVVAKVNDGQVNPVDRPSPLSVGKREKEAVPLKEHDNREPCNVVKGSVEDYKEDGSFKFPRAKRNSGKEKTSHQVMPPSVAGPTTRMRTGFKPPTSSPVKVIPKMEDSKEKNIPKTIKGSNKIDCKAADVEVKRKGVEVSTEPFSKQSDESKRMDYAEEALSIRAINSPSSGSSSKLLEVIRVAEEKGKDIVKVNDVEVMREPVGSSTVPLSLMRKPLSNTAVYSSISVSTEGQRKDPLPLETKSTPESIQTDGSSAMSKFPPGNTESWEFVAKVGEVELLRESPRVTPKPTLPPVTIALEPAVKKPAREKSDSGSRKPGRPSSMPPPSKTPDFSMPSMNVLEQAIMGQPNLRNHSLEVLVGIGNRPGEGSSLDSRAQIPSMLMQMGASGMPQWAMPTEAHSRASNKPTGMETFLAGRKTPVGEQAPESEMEKRKKGTSKARNAPPPRWGSQEADMLSVKVDGHPLGTWSPGDWRSLPSVNMWPPSYSGFVPPMRLRGPMEPRCSRSVSPPSHSGRRGVEHMPEDLSSPPLPRGRRDSPHSFRHPFVHPATSFPGVSNFTSVSVMSYPMSKSNSSALNLAKTTSSGTLPSDTAMNLTMCRQSTSTPTPPPVISSPSVQQSPRQNVPVNLVKSRSSSPKTPAQQAQHILPDGRGAVLPGGIVVPNLPLIFGREYAVGSPSTPPSGRISQCSAEEGRETVESVAGQVVRCSSEPPRDHTMERRPRESPILTGFVPTSVPPRTSAGCQTNQPIQSYPIPRPSSAMSSLEQVPSPGVSRSTIIEPDLLPGGVVIPNFCGPYGFRPGEEQWIPASDGVRLDLPPRSVSVMSQSSHTEESPSKQVTTRMSTPIPSVSTTPIPPSSTPPPAPPLKTGPGRRGGRAETPPPDKYNFRIEEAHVVMSGGGHGGAGGKLFACDICSGVYRRAFSLKRHYLRAHINYCHLSERDLSNCGIVVGDRMAVHAGGSGRRPYVHTTLPRSESKSPEREPEKGSGRRTLLRDLFRCHTCGVCFDEKRRLKAHLMEHQCGSNRPSLLRQHAAAHHVLPPTVAPRPTPTPRPHLSSPTPTVYLCAYCDKRFSSAAVRRRHRKLHESSPGPHPCYLCETAEDPPDMPLRETPSFAHLEDLRSHMASIHRDMYHSCALCGERLPSILALEEHAEEHRSRRQATEQSDEDEEEDDAELVRAAAAAVAPSAESPRQSGGVQVTGTSQTDEEEFRYTCGVCQKMFTNYVNMCRHRRLAHGAAQAKTVGRKAGAASAGKGQAGGRDSESSSRSQSPVVVSQSSERGHRDLLDGEPSSSSSSSVPSPCPYPSLSAASANDPETLFYTRLAGNIRENLLNYLDGKLNKNLSDRQSREDCKGSGYDNEAEEDGKVEPIWEKYNFPKDFQQMSFWDISTQLVVRNNLKKVSNTPAVEPDPEQRPAFPETLALVETSKSGDQTNKEGVGVKEEQEEEVVEGEWSGLSGEWVRPRSYICCACSSRFADLWALEDHKIMRHPNVWCTHLEVEDGAVVLPGTPKLSPGSANVAVSFLGDLLCRRPLAPRGALLSAPSVPPTLNNGMESPSARCTKCSRVCPSLPELHSHMLECGGDLAWAAWAGGSSPAASSRRNSRKWRPFGSRRRRQRGRRGMKRNIPSSPVKMHRARHRGTDSDSIQRMIANLPAKRATRRVIQFNEDEIKTRSQATIHSVSFSGNFVRVSGYKSPLGIKGAPPTAAKRGRPPKNPLPPTPLNIEGMAVPSTSMAIPPMAMPSASSLASSSSPQGAIKKGRGRPPGSKTKTTATNPDFTLKRRFGESMAEGYIPEGDKYAASKRSRPGASPVNQHPISSAPPSVPGEPYVCKGCGAVFDNASSCERHGKKCVFRRQMPVMPSGESQRSTISSNVRPVHACPHCGKNFTYATPMEKHVRMCGSSNIPRGPPVHVRRATAPSALGRPLKAEEEDEVKKDLESQEEASSPPSEEAESQPSGPTQEPDMPQLQKEEPVASPPTKDDDIPVLTPVEPEEEEEAVETVQEDIAKDIKEDISPDVEEPVASIPNEAEVVIPNGIETETCIEEVEKVKTNDEPVVEVKEEVVEMLMETQLEESLPVPSESEKVLPEATLEDTPKDAPAEEAANEVEERAESPEPEDTLLSTTGKRTRASSSGGQVAKKNKVEIEAEEPAVEVETPKRKGGKKTVVVSTRGKSPKGLRTTRGTRGEDEVASEGEEKKEKDDISQKDTKVEECDSEEVVTVKAEVEDIPIQADEECNVGVGKEAPKDDPESLPTDKEDDIEKEDPSMSEGRGKRGRRGKYSAKQPAVTNEVASKATQEKVDSSPVTPRQGKRKGASLERPSSPKVEETPPVTTPEIEPKVTRGSAIAQSKVTPPKEKEVSKEDKGKPSATKKKEEEEVIVSTKVEKVKSTEKLEEPSIDKKEIDEDKAKDDDTKPETHKDGAKAEDSEEEDEDSGDGKDKDGKLRGTKGSKGKVTKKSHKKKKKQELKREVENFWCDACQMGYSSAFNLVKHGMSQKHKWNQKLAKEKEEAAAKESAESEKSKEKKGVNEQEKSSDGKLNDTSEKGGKIEVKENEKVSLKGGEAEKAKIPRSSEGGKGDDERKADEGKTSKKRSIGEVQGTSSIEEKVSSKEEVLVEEEGEESEESVSGRADSTEKTSPDQKDRSVTSEDESVRKGSSVKDKSQEKKTPEKKAQENKPEKKSQEKKSPEKKTPEKKVPEKKSVEKNLPEKDLQEKNLQEKNLQEKNLSEKNLQEKNLQEKNFQEKNLPEKKSSQKKTPEKRSPEKKSQEKKSPEKKSPEKKPQNAEIKGSDGEEGESKKDDKSVVPSESKSEHKECDSSPKEEPQSLSQDDQTEKKETSSQSAVEGPTSENAVDEVSLQEGSKKSPTKDATDGTLIGQTASERGITAQSDSQPAPAQEAEGSITKVSPEATVAVVPESATVIEGTKNSSEAVQCGIWPEAPVAAPSGEFVQPPVPPPANYNMVYEWNNAGVVQQAPVQPAPPPPTPSAMPPQQPSMATHMHPVQQDNWGAYGGWEAPITDPNPPPSPGLWRYQPPNPIPWTEPQHSLSPIPRVPSYEDPAPVTHPSTPNPSPPNPSLGSILDSVNRILGEDVPGFDSSRMQAGATAPEEEYGGVGLFGEGLAELQRAMGATDEEMAMLQQLGTGPLDFVYDNNAVAPNVAYNAADSNDQTGPLPNPELVDLDNQSAAVTIGGDGPIEETDTSSLPPVAADSSNYFGDGRGGKRKRCGPPPSKCKKLAPPPRESNRGWRGGRRLLPNQASLASAHLLISQYEKKEMVCPMCNRHFLGLAALETHVAWVHKVKDAKQHILEGATDGQPSGKKPNSAASNTLRELVAGRAVGGVVVGGGVTSSPTPSRRLPCFVCKELYSDVISLNHHIAQQHLRRRPGEGGAVPEMDGNLKSQMTSALGGLLGKAIANMRSRSDANLQKPGLPTASKSPLFSPFPKLNLLTKSLDAINKMSTSGDSSIRKSFGGGPSSSEGAGESYSQADASSDAPEVGLFRREDGVDPSEWSSDGEDSAKGQEAEGQAEEGEIPSFHHICPFCGDRFQRLTSKNRHITWAHRDMTCMDMRIPRSCSHESSDFDELLGRGRRDEAGDGGSVPKEESEESQETGRRHNHHPCPACQLTFLRHSQLEAHLKRAHNGIDSPLPDTSDSMMECPICRESMNNFLKLCKHVKTKHREWSINCFTTDMHHHLILRKESPEESMVIRKKFLVKMKAFPVLRMASPTPSSRSSEEESYMDPDPKGNYLCSVCGVNFKSPQGVIRHLNLEHNSNHLEGALPLQKIFPRHATKEYRSRSGGGLGSDIKAKAEAALRELNLSQKLKLGAVSSGKGMASKLGQYKKPTSSTSDGSNDSSMATTSKGSGRGRGSSRRGRGKRGGARGGISSDIEKSLFDVYEFEDDDDELEETPSRVGSADGSSRVGSECGDDDEDEDGAEDDGKGSMGSAASIRAKRGSVDSSSSDAKYSCNACGKGYKSLTAFWKHSKGVRGACAGGGSSPGRSGERGSQEGSAGPSVRSGSKASGGRKGEEESVSSDVESEMGGSVRVLRRLRGSTSGASDVGGTEGTAETLHSSEASETAPKRGDKGGGRGGKGKRKGGGGGSANAEEEKKSLFPGGETVRTYGGKRSAKQQTEERRGRSGGGGGGDDGDGAGGSRRSLGASEAAFDALRGGGSS